MKLPVVDTVHPQSDKFVTGVDDKATGDSRLDDSPAWFVRNDMLINICDLFKLISFSLLNK